MRVDNNKSIVVLVLLVEAYHHSARSVCEALLHREILDADI